MIWNKVPSIKVHVQINTTHRDGDREMIRKQVASTKIFRLRSFQSARAISISITDNMISAQQPIDMFPSRKEGNPTGCRMLSCRIWHCLKTMDHRMGEDQLARSHY
uniref:Uncharacterized protein n=2 Tax=Arundo donax TaxID=35708 RepID=A0A0A9DL42_ARUDO